MSKPLIEIKNLSAGINGKQILKGINLTVRPGEVHAIMGPNGSGKSTLGYVLAGRKGYDVTGGSVTYDGKDLIELPPEDRAREGLFLAFQYPVEIPGVNNTYFLRAAYNEQRKHRGQEEVDAVDFLAIVKEVSMQFVYCYDGDEFARSLHAIAEGLVPVDPLITGVVGLDGVADAHGEDFFDTLAIEAYHLAKDERLAEAALPSLVIVAIGLAPLVWVSRRYFRRDAR